ncbi:MAG TPA: hypothetical protein VFK11_00700 [Candidatus Saccharimonadales bacterium]|nr:hypothetical protein [Candidatus Saccharimonadales bacterium]
MNVRLISEILEIPQPVLFHHISELERLAGRPGLDIRLAGELKLLFKEKARQLGLDENDTTPKELYYAMSVRVLKDSDELAKTIGIAPDDSPQKMVEKSIAFVEKRIGKKTAWGLKPAVLRKQIVDNPPKKLMKIFSLRSVESALKRERVSVFYCFARLVESPAWFGKYAQQARKLTNSNFDDKEITINILPANRREQLKKAGVKLNRIVYSDQESSAIEIAVPERRFAGDVLFLTDAIINQIRKMLQRSAYYKNKGFEPDFFAEVENIRLHGFPVVEASGFPFAWPVIVHAVTEHGQSGLINDTEPAISPDDIIVPSIAQAGGLDLWKHPFGIHKSTDIVVPFNLSDMIINSINDTHPKKAYIENARAGLRNELFARYLKHDTVREKMLGKEG